MMIEKNKGILKRYIEEVWNKGDVSVLDNLMAQDHVCHGMRTDVYVTRDMVRKAVIGIHKEYTDFRIAIDDILAEGDSVASRIQMSGIRNEDGKEYYLDELMIHRILNGKINGSWTIGSEWKEKSEDQKRKEAW
jgi:ketosteroid isomerase-like protein